MNSPDLEKVIEHIELILKTADQKAEGFKRLNRLKDAKNVKKKTEYAKDILFFCKGLIEERK